MRNTKIIKYLFTIVLNLAVLNYASANFLTKFFTKHQNKNIFSDIKTETINEDSFIKIKPNTNKNLCLKATANENLISRIKKLSNYTKNKWGYLTIEELNKVFKEYLNLNSGVGVRKCQFFTPDNFKDKDLSNVKPTVIFVIHGTWAKDNTSYYAEDKKFYSGILNYAEKLAYDKQSPIEVISFQWQGNNSSNARIDAADLLAKVINEMYYNYRIITIAHSHGCNVVNNASQKLAAGIEISKIVHFACPIREESEQDNKFTPMNFKKLYHFYSTSDLVAPAGSITTHKFSPKGCRKFKSNSTVRVKNIRTMENGYDLGHCNITESIAPYLYNVLSNIDKNYIFNNDLELNIEKEQKNNIIIAIRHDLTLNVEKTAEIMNHLNFKIEKLKQKIDKNEKYKEKINNLSTKLNNIEKAIITEYQYSKDQKDLFKKRYNFDMSNKGNIFYRISNGTYQDGKKFISKIKNFFNRQ